MSLVIPETRARRARCVMVVRHGAALLLGVASLAPHAQLPAQAPPVVRHPAGYAITLPRGWRAQPIDESQIRVLAPNAPSDEALVFVVAPAGGVTSVTDPASVRQSEAQMLAQYPQLRRVGPLRTLATGIGSGIRLDFENTTGSAAARLAIYAAVRNDQTVSIIAAGPAAAISARLAALDAVFVTLRSDLAAPPAVATGLHDGSAAAREWSTRLAGRTLTVMSGYSSSGSSGGMTSRSDLALRRDGRFSYTSSSSVSISVDGMGGSSSGRNAAQGTWRISSRGGSTSLALTASDGKRESFVLSRRGTQTFLNGTRAFVTTP